MKRWISSLVTLLVALTSCTTTSPTAEGEAYVSWNDYNTHYVERGSGSNHVLLLHGFSASTYSWRNQMDELTSKGYHVWAIDLLGFGLSDKPTDIDYSLELYRKEVLDFMQFHGIEKSHLVGHSMGGTISLSLTIHATEKFLSLTLVDPAGYPLQLPTALSLGKKLGKFGAAFINRDTIHTILKQVYFDPEKITEEQIDAYYIPFQMEGGKRACMKVLKAFENETLEDQSEFYSSIKLPTLIVWGEKDLWIPVEHLQLYAKSMPMAKQVILKDCGHSPQEEAHAEFNAHFIQFLKDH